MLSKIMEWNNNNSSFRRMISKGWWFNVWLIVSSPRDLVKEMGNSIDE